MQSFNLRFRPFVLGLSYRKDAEPVCEGLYQRDWSEKDRSPDVVESVVDRTLLWPALMLFEIGLQLRFGLYRRQLQIPVASGMLTCKHRNTRVRSAPDESYDSELSVRHGDIMAGRNPESNGRTCSGWQRFTTEPGRASSGLLINLNQPDRLREFSCGEPFAVFRSSDRYS